MANDLIRQHKQVIIRAYVNNPPTEREQLSEWCRQVISTVGMKVIGGPLTVYSDMDGNKGFTSVAILDFSHLAIHTWDEISPALIEFDLFSCKDFDSQDIVDMLNQFDIVSYSVMSVDRDHFDQQQIVWK